MGRFIAIEGGDGSGKGTHTRLLVDYLKEKSVDVLEVDFPRYGQPSAYYVEQYLNGKYGGPNDVHAELGSLPYALDRFAAKPEIETHLKSKDAVVISNRYVASNLAHQGTKIADETERQSFYERTKEIEFGLLAIPRPDLNIVLIMPSDIAQSNVDKKDTRGYTSLKRDIHEADADHLTKAKANYEELCELYPDEFIRVECIDESGELKSIEAIQLEIRKIIN